jgi:short-subunit dehydrogenase
LNIIITGATSGIGKALSLHYSKDSANNLFLISKNKEKLSQLKSQIKCKTFEVDVSDFEKLQVVVNIILSKIDKIDLVIANAGISLGHNNHFTSFQDFKMLNDINYLSVHALFEPIIEKMKKQKSGKLVVISSLASFVSMPSSFAYSSSKRALNSYCEGLRNLLSVDNIDVLNIQPGFIKTNMTDKNDFKMPFLLELDDATIKITDAIEKNKKEYAFPKSFYLIVKLVSILPNFVKDVVIRNIHNKK